MQTVRFVTHRNDDIGCSIRMQLPDIPHVGDVLLLDIATEHGRAGMYKVVSPELVCRCRQPPSQGGSDWT